MLSTPQDLFNLYSKYFSIFPRSEKDVRELLEKVKTIFQTESTKYNSMWNTYRRAITGDATVNNINDANKQAKELLTSLRFAGLLALPGSLFLLPILIQLAKEHNIDIIPDTVKKEFSIN